MMFHASRVSIQTPENKKMPKFIIIYSFLAPGELNQLDLINTSKTNYKDIRIKFSFKRTHWLQNFKIEY